MFGLPCRMCSDVGQVLEDTALTQPHLLPMSVDSSSTVEPGSEMEIGQPKVTQQEGCRQPGRPPGAGGGGTGPIGWGFDQPWDGEEGVVHDMWQSPAPGQGRAESGGFRSVLGWAA
jgi:hypothetical protein